MFIVMQWLQQAFSSVLLFGNHCSACPVEQCAVSGLQMLTLLRHASLICPYSLHFTAYLRYKMVLI